jgi:hypothetical protein
MDMLSPSPQSSSWPNTPAERGKYYGCPDPVWKGMNLVVMTDDTWLDFGTLFERTRRERDDALKTLVEQKAVIAQLTAKLNDVTDRLEATRAARKKEKLSWLGLGPKVKKDD